MTGPGPGKRNSVIVHDSFSGPVNHRDASNTSETGRWRNPPTPISIPGSGTGEHVQRHPPRAHDNPYFRTANTLGSQLRRPGNPNVRQTVLAKAKVPDGSSFGADSHARKRQKLDISISSTMASNGASSSYARGLAPRSSVSEPDIQVIEPTNNRTHPVPNDAEIIDLEVSSSDLGERVPRAVKSSSPDPILIGPNGVPKEIHIFETYPTKYSSSASNKGKGRAKELPERVEGSEEDESIEEFPPTSRKARPLSNAKESREIPMDIVPQRREYWENVSASAPAASYQPIEKVVNSVDLTSGSVISKMKRKDEGPLGHQKSTGVSDSVGTSSSNFLNSAREKERTQTLPLKAWCLGQHLFQHSESAPLKLVYEVALHRIKVIWGRSPPEKLDFKLDRDVCSAMVVNDSDEPLRENVVIQFSTIPGSTWKEAERKYKGFVAGGGRGREALTFLFSTEKDRSFSTTAYQRFVMGIKKAFRASDTQIIRSSKGATIWDYASQFAAMFERTVSRSTKEDRSESIPDEPSALIRSVTPCSSTSVKIGSELKPSNGDSGSSMPHRRSARQSAIRSLRASPPPLPPAQLELDEVVLMYPPTGTGALSIMQSDLRRLLPEEYLNDTLIEFGLKLWLNDLHGKDPALASQIHVFSSFFYKKLNNRKKFVKALYSLTPLLIEYPVHSPEDGYNSVRKWTSKVDLFTKKYIIVPINENVHWYLAIIYEPGHTLEPPLQLTQPSNARMTRKRRKQERAKANSETLTEVSLERSSLAGHITEGEPEADASSMNATRATTPSVPETEDMDDVTITVFDKSCSITAGSEPASTTSFGIQVRGLSPNLVHPPSDSMDVDADTSVTDVIPNPTCEVAEVLEPSTSKPSSGIPVSQFYGCMPKPGDEKPVVIVDNEDSGEDQQQEAEVDDMLAVTQSPTGDLPQTHIFTLDSLGTRHPQAIKVLKQYLVSEAKDKRNFDEVRDAVGKPVQVPVQPNTWDCGAYLLHFVKVFMNAPSEFVDQILSTKGTMPSSDRKKMWQDHEIPQFRDHLKSRIIQLSEEWKAGKTIREQETSKRRSGDTVEVEPLSSEGEVDIVEDIPSVKTRTAGPRQNRLATRLRG